MLPALSPFVVPRRVEFDEVVDNHQVPFVTMMEKQGGAIIVESRADLFDKLTLAFENPSLFHAAKPYVANPSIAAEQLAQGSIICFRGGLAVLRDI